MTEDCRRALDSNIVSGIIIYISYCATPKAARHGNSLANCYQITMVNGCGSSLRKVSFGVPQGSVLGSSLFSLFSNVVPEIVSDSEGYLHI